MASFDKKKRVVEKQRNSQKILILILGAIFGKARPENYSRSLYLIHWLASRGINVRVKIICKLSSPTRRWILIKNRVFTNKKSLSGSFKIDSPVGSEHTEKFFKGTLMQIWKSAHIF